MSKVDPVTYTLTKNVPQKILNANVTGTVYASKNGLRGNIVIIGTDVDIAPLAPFDGLGLKNNGLLNIGALAGTYYWAVATGSGWKVAVSRDFGYPETYNEDFIIKVQKGLIPGHSTIAKFAENPDMDSSVSADIWDYPDAVKYTFSDSAIIDSISSSDVDDMVEMVIQGLDVNWEDVTQVVSLNGQTRVALSTPLIRFNRGFNGNGTALQGNVYVYENTTLNVGIPVDKTKVRGYIQVIEQQTLQGIYTIPAGKTGYFLGFSASLSKETSSSNVIMTGQARGFERVFRTQLRFSLKSTGSSEVSVPSNSFSIFPEKTDFIAFGLPSASSTGVSITFDLLLVDN